MRNMDYNKINNLYNERNIVSQVPSVNFACLKCYEAITITSQCTKNIYGDMQGFKHRSANFLFRSVVLKWACAPQKILNLQMP